MRRGSRGSSGVRWVDYIANIWDWKDVRDSVACSKGRGEEGDGLKEGGITYIK